MKQPKFYQAVLVPVDDVIKHCYPNNPDLTLKDRFGDCTCEICGGNEWYLLPKECQAVVGGGKPYVECLNCGDITHL